MQPSLAAVMAADIVGYSRMMGEDAQGTVAALRRLRSELFNPAVAGYRGKLVKSMGDGWIVTFSSAVDAVTCAMRLQDDMVLEPGVAIRIGIHLGDLTHEGDDIFGDGVNVAARLETVCDPGGVSISDAVFSMLDGTLRPAFDDAGEISLKNITRPVRVWNRGGITGATVLKTAKGTDGFPQLDIRPVATSDNPSNMADLANALTHDINKFLGQTRWLKTTIKETPGAGSFVLTSNLRTSGVRLRLDAHLTDPQGTTVWTAKYDGSQDGVFDWQDETGSAVASSVLAKTGEQVRKMIFAKSEADRSWEDWFVISLPGSYADHDSMSNGMARCFRAIGMNPPSSVPYESFLAAWAGASSIGYQDLSDKYQAHVPGLVEKAIELAGGAATTRAMLAFTNYVRSGDAVQARRDVDAFLRDLPFDPEVLTFAGFLFNFLGEPDRSLECFTKFGLVGKQLTYGPVTRTGVGIALLMLGGFEDAIAEFDETILQSPGYPVAFRGKAAALAQLGRLDEARAVLSEHDEIIPGMTLTSVRAGAPYVDNAATQNYFDGLRKAGMPAE